MAERIAISFAVAALAVLVLGAVLRAVARRGRRWPRQTGGIALFVVAPVGLLAATSVPPRAVAVVGGALVLGLVGLLRDRVSIPAWLVGLIVAGVSVGVTAAGLRFPLGGVPAVDFVWTVAWLGLVTATIANSGNADGQLPALGAASTLGIVGVAGFGLQSAAATIAAALLGALVAFLAYNWRPASLFLGRVGAWFAGFLVASGAIWARPSIGRPGSLLVSVMIVGVALLDGTMVLFSRLRRRRPLTVRIRDHVSHRLVAAGMRPSRMILLLAVVQLALSVVAVFVARGVLSLGVGAIVAVGLGLVVWIGAMRARMRDVGGVPGMSWRARLVVFGAVVFVVVASGIAAVSAIETRTKVLAARDYAEAAITAARDGDSERAVELFTQAEANFTAADDKLGSILNVPSLVVPVVGSNVYAARELTRVGLDLSRAGRQLTQDINADDLRLVDGRVPLASVASIAPQLDDAASLLRASSSKIDGLSRAFLVGELDRGVRDLRSQLADASGDATRAANAARLAPRVLGQDGPRTYLLVVQNPAEQRATGGLVGNWGILTASDGSIDVSPLQRTRVINSRFGKQKVLHASKEYVDRYGQYDPARSFQNANMSPDFPSAAAVMADVYRQSRFAAVGGVEAVDGVVAVDPLGLAALLELTGPVRVPGWPNPISAQNVVDVTVRDAYANYVDNEDRIDFLGEVARVAIDKATDGDLGSMDQLSKVLGKAAHQGHFSVWFKDPALQATVDDLEISGRVPRPRGDSLLITNSNASANKLDYYTSKTIDYTSTVSPSPDLQVASVVGTAVVTYANSAPTSGLTQYVAGPWEGNPTAFVYGQNKQYVSVYSPLDFTGARVGDQGIDFDIASELGRSVMSAFVDVFAQQSQSLTVDLAGRVDLARNGWYELELIRQPALRADTVHVAIGVPDGYRIVATRGLEVVDGVAKGTISLDETRTVAVKIAPSAGLGVWDRLRSGA